MVRLDDRRLTQCDWHINRTTPIDWVASDHVSEWIASGVDPGIIALNVETLTDTATNDYSDSLFPIAERLNWKITRFGQKTRSNLRGWWVSGIDPLNNWQRMEWGRFTPDAATPVMAREKGKPAKYLSPSLGPGSSRLVLLDVPQHIWDKVARRYNIPIANEDRPLGFWHWVWKYLVPVILTEGEKKAGCLLTQGYAAIALLKEVDFDIDAQTDPITLRSWAKMAARVNVSLWSYRSEFRNGLLMEGHQVTTVTDDLLKLLPPEFQSLCTELAEMFGAKAISQALKEDLLKGVLQFPGVEYLQWQHNEIVAELVTQDIKEIQEASRLSEAQAIALAPILSTTEYEQLKDQRAKTADERHAQHKHELQRRYSVPITPELKIKDDEGWYTKLRLHYYLTHDPEFVRLRDLKEWQGHLDRGDGKIALQDVRLLTAQIETFKVLGVLNLLEPERQVRAIDADVEQIRHQAVQFSHDIKAVLNLTISEKMTPIEVVQALLGKLGLKLTCVGRDVAADGRRGGTRVYQYQPPEDGRVAIFAQWQQRDSLTRSSQEGLIPSVPVTVTTPDPPPDISITNQSRDGVEGTERLLEETPQMTAERGGRSFRPHEVNGRGDGDRICEMPSIEAGSLVKRLRQTCCWVVNRLEGVAALLKHPQTKEECIVPLDELILVSEEGFS